MPTFLSLKGGAQVGILKLNGPHTPSSCLFLFAHCVSASTCTRNSLRTDCGTTCETLPLPAENSRLSAPSRATLFPLALPGGWRALRTWHASKLPCVSICNGGMPAPPASLAFSRPGYHLGLGPSSVTLSSRRAGSAAYMRNPSASLSQPNPSPASPRSEPNRTACGHPSWALRETSLIACCASHSSSRRAASTKRARALRAEVSAQKLDFHAS